MPPALIRLGGIILTSNLKNLQISIEMLYIGENFKTYEQKDIFHPVGISLPHMLP